MKAILTILMVLLLLAQIRLWHDVREIRGLRALVEQQLEENRRLDSRNEALAAEVDDLRAGLQAIEERARSELGLIREGEEFFIVVDPEAIDPQRLQDDAAADPDSPPDPDTDVLP